MTIWGIASTPMERNPQDSLAKVIPTANPRCFATKPPIAANDCAISVPMMNAHLEYACKRLTGTTARMDTVWGGINVHEKKITMKNSYLLSIFYIVLMSITFISCDDSKKDHTNNINNINNTNNTNNTNNMNNINNTNNANCGNNRIDASELCDGSQLGDATCESLGYTSGTLACATDCRAYDTAGCTGEPGPYGFFIRQPQTRELLCENSSMSFRDADHICTFNFGNIVFVIYFQATPTKCIELLILPQYTTVAWVSFENTIMPVSQATYDYGGNHHNDTLHFTLVGQKFTFFHSSFGWGYRSCQPMDCMRKLNDQDQIIEDGCTPERTLPIVCRAIKDDGTFDELNDTFEKCPGDPNAK